ncbi:diguanylate cyclase [Shewanella sp. A3A]|nr:diguanylate cyclase [Shewanella ferrihydritica]
MHTLPNSELVPVIEKIDNAILSHRMWVRRLMRTITCHVEHSNIDLFDNAHELCAFGQWYYGEHPQELTKHPIFCDIQHHHQLLHQTAALMLRSESHLQSVSTVEFDDFYLHLDDFVNKLEEFKKELNILLYNRDPLTGAFNRRSLDDELVKIGQLLASNVKRACIIMFDLDHFKSINDNYGHSVGDDVLKGTIDVVIKHLRSLDKVFRYGGEEFVISLIQTDMPDAVKLAELMRTEIEQMALYTAGNIVKATASFGIAELKPYSDITSVVNQADQALYYAKAHGRNKVATFNEVICERNK